MKDITPPPTPPFCIECAHFIPEEFGNNIIGEGRIAAEPNRCQRFQILDVVTGKPFYVPCSHVREKGAPCDTVGKLFQSKPVDSSAN